MATWHQQRAQARSPVRFDHPTLWTVVIDPPQCLRASICFTTEEAARKYLVGKTHVYVLPPRSTEGEKK